MAETDGIQIPVSVEADAATVTIEKLAAKILDLEAAVKKMGDSGKKAGDDMGKGILQGIGQKVWEQFSTFLEGLPAKLDRVVNASSGWADNLQELGARSGFAVKQLEEYGLAAKTSGLNLNSLTRFAQQLTPQLLKNRDAFTSLGLSFNELAGLDPGAQFEKVQKALVGIDDPAKRLQATVEIFGKRLGPQLQPFLDSLEEGRKRAEELGLVISEKSVKAAADFQDELDTLKEAQDGVTRSLGAWITEDEDLRSVLHDLTSEVGDFNKWVQELGKEFRGLPKEVKAAVVGIGYFGAQIVGYIPTITAFAAQIAMLGGPGAVWAGIASGATKAAGAVKAFTISLATNPAVLAALAIAATAIASVKLGEWLYENTKFFRELGDAIGGALVDLGEFLDLLPDAQERAQSELARGAGPGAGLTGAEFTAAIQAAKKQADALRETQATAAAPVVALTKEELEAKKQILSLEGQLAAIGAQRAGAVAAANQQLAQTVALTKLDFEIQKTTLDERKATGDIQQAQYDREIEKATRVRDLTIQIAQAQADAARRQAALGDRIKEVDAAKQLADIEVQIGQAKEGQKTAYQAIFATYDDAVAKADREREITLEKLALEVEILGLTGEALKAKEKDIAQAVLMAAKQKELAAAVRDAALEQQRFAEAVKRGLEPAKELAEEIDKIRRATENPLALVTGADLSLLDQETERLKRLGQEFKATQDLADATFRKLQGQEIQTALDELATKFRRGVEITGSDVAGLQTLRNQLGLSAEEAAKLDAALRRAKDALNSMKLDPNRIRQEIQDQAEALAVDTQREAMKRKIVEQMIAEGKISKEMAEKLYPEMFAQQLNVGNAIRLAVGFMQQLGLAADSTLGSFVNMAAAALQARDAGKQAKAAWESGNKTQAVGAGLSTAANIYNSNKQNLSGANAALSGAAQGAAFGSAFGPLGAGIGAVAGGLIGFFSGSKFRKIAKDAGKVLGEGLSSETVKKIEEDSKKLGISIKKASLLSISEAMADTGKAAATYAPQVGELMKAIADGSVPAKEGLAEVGEMFSQIADDALKAGTVGDKVMVGLLKQARALKLESPEMKAFVSEQLDSALEGVHKFVAAITTLSDEAIGKLGKESGIIFGAMFDALVSEKGIVGAVDALKGDFDALREKLTASLGTEAMEAILGPFGAAFATLGDEKLRPIFEGIDGITQAMKGLANSGYLSLDAFTAMQDASAKLFDEAIAGGADMKTALLAVAPGIQAAISAAEQFGVPLDEDTQRLKELAEANGIAFKTDPQEAMLDVMVAIAEVLGADIPESAKRAKAALEDLKNATPGEINVGGGGAAGGTAGPRAVQANVTVNLGVNENPLAAADTAAAMRQATVEWAAEAIEDRVPSIIAAIEGN